MKRILATVLAAVQILTVSVYADTKDIDYSVARGAIKDFDSVEATSSQDLFSIENSTKKYILIDTYNNDGEREFFVMTDYAAPKKSTFDADAVLGFSKDTADNFYYMVKEGSGASWGSKNNNYAYDPENPNSAAYFINTEAFIDVMIDESVDEYVVSHVWENEPVWKEANADTLKTTESRYALPAVSEYLAYSDIIGRQVKPLNYTGSSYFHWYFRTPFVDGTASSFIMHKTNVHIRNWAFADYWDSTFRPVFYLSSDFFKNVKLDLSALGANVIKKIDFPSLMTKDEALAVGYTEEEWASLAIIDIKEQTTEDYYITSNGKVKSGYTLTVNGTEETDTVQYIKSTDGENGFFIDGGDDKEFCLTNDLAGSYIAALVTKENGDKYITDKVLVQDNAKVYSGWINVPLKNENDDAAWKLKFKNQPGDFTVVDYNEENGEMLLMSGIAYNSYESGAEFYTSETPVQKYDENDENSIAYRINQESFINDRLISADYISYIPVKAWETEKYFNGNDSVSFARIALPSLTELLTENYIERIGYKVGSGTGNEAGFKLRTPYSSADSFYYLRKATEKGSAQSEGAGSNYYPSRVEFYLDDDIFKVLKIDIENTGAEVKKLAFSDLSAEDANTAGYTSEELKAEGIYFPEISNLYILGMNTVGSTLEAKYIYSHAGDVREGDSEYTWYRVSEDGTETKIDENGNTYIIKENDINYRIYCEVKPKDINETEGVAVTSKPTKKIEEGICSLEGYSVSDGEAEASVIISNLNIKASGIKADIVFTAYDGYHIKGQTVIKDAGNYSGELVIDSAKGAYLVLAVINSETLEPLVVITENEAVIPRVEDGDGFLVTPYPSEEAIVVHGRKEGFSALDDVVIVVTKKGEDDITYIGADKLSDDGRLLHTFGFSEDVQPGAYELTVYKQGASETVEFTYTTPEIKADIIVNKLGKITADKFADVISDNMQALEISDKYINKMTKADLEKVGELLEGKSYTEETVTDFYNDISDAAALYEITTNDNPKEVAEYYSDEFNFPDTELKQEFNSLENPDNVYKMFKGKALLSFTDAKNTFNESVVLQMINEADSYGIIADVLDKYEDYISFSLTGYKNSDKNKTALYIIENSGNYTKASELEEDIKEAVKKQKETSGGSDGGNSSSGGNKKGNTIVSENIPAINVDIVAKKLFDDVSNDFWAYSYIAGLKDMGIVNGDGGMFYPEKHITREEFVKLVVVAMGITDENATCGFSDVKSGNWAEKYIASAYNAGIINGVGENMFGFGREITRQDMAVIICNATNMKKEDAKLYSFSDAEEISDYAKISVAALADTGVLNGFEDGTFKPHNPSTKAQAAAVIYRIVK